MGSNAVLHRADAAHGNDLVSSVDVAIAHGQVVEHEAKPSIEADRLNMHAIHAAGGSFLVDWDTLGARPRAWRTGAWQSMSVALLLKRKENQESRDDFESFLWTLLYYILRYRPTCVKGPVLQELIHDIFDVVKVKRLGGDGKLAFLHNLRFVQDDVEASALPMPLQNILEALRDMFQPLYMCGRRLTPTQVETRIKAEEATSTSEAIKKIFEENLALPGWPLDDKATE